MPQKRLTPTQMLTAVLALYWLALFIGTHIPMSSGTGGGGLHLIGLYVNDKVLHLGAYGGLTFLLAWVLSSKSPLSRADYLGLWLVAIIYGAADEMLQKLIEGRHADFWDWVADGGGGFASLIAFAVARRVWNRRKTRRQPDDDER